MRSLLASFALKAPLLFPLWALPLTLRHWDPHVTLSPRRSITLHSFGLRSNYNLAFRCYAILVDCGAPLDSPCRVRRRAINATDQCHGNCWICTFNLLLPCLLPMTQPFSSLLNGKEVLRRSFRFCLDMCPRSLAMTINLGVIMKLWTHLIKNLQHKVYSLLTLPSHLFLD